MQIAEEAVAPAQSQKYQNFIIRYNQNVHGDFDYRSDENFQIVNDLFGILYVAEQDVPELGFNSYSYSSIPKCYTYMDSEALSTSGVLKLHDHPYLNLKGAGTLVAVIDSGIDYRHPAFRNGNQSKIVSIWDQSLPGKRQARFPMEGNLQEIRSMRHFLLQIHLQSFHPQIRTDMEQSLPPQPQETVCRRKIFPGQHQKRSL